MRSGVMFRWAVGLAAVALVSLCGCKQMGGLWTHEPEKKPAGGIFTNESAPDKFTKEQVADVQAAMARSMETQGDVDQAISTYQEVLAKDKGRSDVHYRLAILYDKKGDVKNAQKHYEVALKALPKNADLHCDYGYSLTLREKWSDAEKSFRQAIAINGNHARAHNHLGLLLARQGKKEDALEQFELAGCNKAAAQSNLAYGLARGGHLKEAEEHFQIALSLDRNLKSASDGLAGLQTHKARQAAAKGDKAAAITAMAPQMMAAQTQGQAQ